MSYNSNIIPGNPPLLWSDVKSAFDEINANFAILGSALARTAPVNIAHIESGTIESNPVRISTVEDHNFLNAARATITETGISQLDNNTYFIKIISKNEVELFSDEGLSSPIDGTAFDGYASGGGKIQSTSEFASIDFENLYTSLTPAETGIYSLGVESRSWKTLYVTPSSDTPGNEDNGIWLGAAQIKGTISGAIDLPLGSTVNGDLIIDPNQTFFKSVQVDNGNQIVANEFIDILNINSGTAINIVVDSAAESLTINNTGVTELNAGLGISVSDTTNSITVSNTGVLSLTNISTLPAGLVPGSGISVSSSTGNVSITNTGILDVQNGFGITVSKDTATGIVTVTNSAPAQVAYRTIRVDGSSDLIADSTADVLVVEAGYGMTITTSELTDDKLILEVNPEIDIVGSVFADDSSIMVDSIDQKIFAINGFTGEKLTLLGYNIVQLTNILNGVSSEISSINLEIASLTSQLFAPPWGGMPNPGPNPVIQAELLQLNSQLSSLSTEQSRLSTLLNDPQVDIEFNAVEGITEFDKGIYSPFIRSVFEGDLTGSIFSDSSTILVDGTNAQIVGPVNNATVNTQFLEIEAGGSITMNSQDILGAGTITTSTLNAAEIDTVDSSTINIIPSVNCNSNLTVGGDILPSTNLGGDLGSPTQQWKSLYVSGSTIFLGGVAVSVENGGLSVEGSEVADTTYVDNAIANLVASAPATLDTLNELAAALGDDANFASTVTTALGNKLESLADDTTPQLSGNLDLNNFDIDGTGNINITGDITSTNITGPSGGDISGYTNITGDSGGTISQFTNITGDSGGTISQFTNITGDSGGTISQFTNITGDSGGDITGFTNITGDSGGTISQFTNITGDSGGTISQFANITGDSGGTISGFTTLTGDGFGSISGFGDITVTTVFAGTIDTTDSSAITVVPAVTFNSDVTVENELFVSNSITAANFLGNVTATSVVTSSITTSKVKESVSEKTGATGVVVHDLSTSSVFYHTSISANFTANFTNLNIGAGQGTNISLLLVQGGTAYIPNAVQIGGVAQTINWQDSSPPTGNTNKIDIVTFSIVRIGDTYTVFGALTSFGT